MGKAADQVGVVNFADRIFIRLAGIGDLGLFPLFVRHVLRGLGLPDSLYRGREAGNGAAGTGIGNREHGARLRGMG